MPMLLISPSTKSNKYLAVCHNPLELLSCFYVARAMREARYQRVLAGNGRECWWEVEAWERRGRSVGWVELEAWRDGGESQSELKHKNPLFFPRV